MATNPWDWQAQAAATNPLYAFDRRRLDQNDLLNPEIKAMLVRAGAWNSGLDEWERNYRDAYSRADSEGNMPTVAGPDMSGLAGYELGDARSEGNTRLMGLFNPQGQMFDGTQYQGTGSWRSGDYASMLAATAGMLAPGVLGPLANGLGVSSAVAGGLYGAGAGALSGGVGGGWDGALRGALRGGAMGYAGGLLGDYMTGATGQMGSSLPEVPPSQPGLEPLGQLSMPQFDQLPSLDGFQGAGSVANWNPLTGGSPFLDGTFDPSSLTSGMNAPTSWNPLAQSNGLGFQGTGELLDMAAGVYGQPTVPDQVIEITGRRPEVPDRIGSPMPQEAAPALPTAQNGPIEDYLRTGASEGSTIGNSITGAGGAAGAVGAGTAASMIGGAGGLLSSIGNAIANNPLQAAVIGAGAVSGAQPSGGGTQTTSRNIDPRMDEFLYGNGGLLGQMKDWYTANKSGTNPTIQEGQNMQLGLLRDPNTMADLGRLRQSSMGLLGGSIAGNPFAQAPFQFPR